MWLSVPHSIATKRLDEQKLKGSPFIILKVQNIFLVIVIVNQQIRCFSIRYKTMTLQPLTTVFCFTKYFYKHCGDQHYSEILLLILVRLKITRMKSYMTEPLYAVWQKQGSHRWGKKNRKNKRCLQNVNSNTTSEVLKHKGLKKKDSWTYPLIIFHSRTSLGFFSLLIHHHNYYHYPCTLWDAPCWSM